MSEAEQTYWLLLSQEWTGGDRMDEHREDGSTMCLGLSFHF